MGLHQLIRNVRRFLSRKQNLLAVAIVSFYSLVSVAAPYLAPPDDPNDPSPTRTIDKGGDIVSRTSPHPPSPDLPFGTLPRRGSTRQIDIFYSIVWGTRSALRFGLIVALTTAGFGVLIGAASAYFGGWINGLVMRVTDAFLTFPTAAGVVLIGYAMFPPGQNVPLTTLQQWLINLQLSPVMVTLILFSWMRYARIVNANVAQLKQAEFVLAAQAVGARSHRIILRHLIPNASPPAIVLAAGDIGGMVILDAAFAFIGIGGSTQWGSLLAFSRDWIIGVLGNPLTYWWVFLPATLALVFFGIGWNLLGDGLNDMLNPRANR